MKFIKNIVVFCMVATLLVGCDRNVKYSLVVETTETDVVEATNIIEEIETTEDSETEIVETEGEILVTEEIATEEFLVELENAIDESLYDLTLAQELFAAVNDVRVEHGLKPLEWDDQLYKTAQVRVEEATRNWSHTRPDGTKWSTLWEDLDGENLARGYSKDEVIDAWMNSETHKENILREEFVRGAIAYYIHESGTEFWCQHFGY